MKKTIEYTACDELSSLKAGAEGLSGSLYSANFVEFLSGKASIVNYTSDYINEIFMHFYLKVAEIASVLKANGADGIVFKSFKGGAVHAAAAKSEKLDMSAISKIYFYFMSVVLYVVSFFLLVISAFALPGLALLTRRGRVDEVPQEFSIIRSPASYDKMRFLNDSGKVTFYYDDIFQRKPSTLSMYSFGSLSERGLSLVIVPFLAFRDFFRVANDARKLLGWCYTGFALYYFAKRISHKCNFEYYFNLRLKKNKPATYYTGNKEDRFAILEKRLCEKYAVPTVCVPHGIEYAFKTPAGLVGDVFYCTTEHARQHLSELYVGEQTFIYDENIARQMFSRGQDIAPITDIVFFPESRDPEVNVSIIGHLLGLGYKIAVKLHPKDSLENYKDYAGQVTFVSDFDSSISNKICLARKSTVLVEAIYNNSIPIAILTDQRDRGYVEHMLPSLIDDQISRVYSFEELACVLAKLQASA